MCGYVLWPLLNDISFDKTSCVREKKHDSNSDSSSFSFTSSNDDRMNKAFFFDKSVHGFESHCNWTFIAVRNQL